MIEPTETETQGDARRVSPTRSRAILREAAEDPEIAAQRARTRRPSGASTRPAAAKHPVIRQPLA